VRPLRVIGRDRDAAGWAPTVIGVAAVLIAAFVTGGLLGLGDGTRDWFLQLGLVVVFAVAWGLLQRLLSDSRRDRR
jgi:hypothetical protein